MARPSPRKRRRIESSSAELEEVKSTRRHSARQAILVRSGSDDDGDGGPDDADDTMQALRGTSTTDNEEGEDDPARRTNGHSHSESAQRDDESEQPEQEEDPVLAEKQAVWDMFAEEYHDIVEQLPLELERNFQLMLQHDQQARDSERALEKSLLDFLAIARETPYRSALARDSHVRRAQFEEKERKRLSALAASASAAAAAAAIVAAAEAQDKPSGATPAGISKDTPSKSTRSRSTASGEELRIGQEPITPAAKIASHEVPRQEVTPPHATTALSEEDQRAAERLKDVLAGLSRALRAAIRLGEDKVALTTTSYDWVDRHIRRLDSDLLKHEEALSLGLRAGTVPSIDAQQAQAQAVENAALTTRQGQGLDQSMGKCKGKSALGGKGKGLPPIANGQDGVKTQAITSGSASKPPNKWITIPPDVVADSNDPKYCYCDQVSYGNMIACDNDNCEREWFHQFCAGLAVLPKGKWYCRICAAALGIKRFM